MLAGQPSAVTDYGLQSERIKEAVYPAYLSPFMDADFLSFRIVFEGNRVRSGMKQHLRSKRVLERSQERVHERVKLR